MDFAHQLRLYKAELGVNLEELAAIVGTTRPTIADWISGKSRPAWRVAEEGVLVRLQRVIDRTPPCQYIGR
jgi:transcriptional regulator with XRE-family HTH domain